MIDVKNLNTALPHLRLNPDPFPHVPLHAGMYYTHYTHVPAWKSTAPPSSAVPAPQSRPLPACQSAHFALMCGLRDGRLYDLCCWILCESGMENLTCFFSTLVASLAVVARVLHGPCDVPSPTTAGAVWGTVLCNVSGAVGGGGGRGQSAGAGDCISYGRTCWAVSSTY